MEESVCRVTLGNITKEYKKGTTYSEIAREFQPDYEHQIVLAMVDGYHLRELWKTVEKDCEIHFLTTADSIGNDTNTAFPLFSSRMASDSPQLIFYIYSIRLLYFRHIIDPCGLCRFHHRKEDEE